MANVIIRPDWHIPEKLVTTEGDYRNRRQFIKEMGLVAGAGISAGAFAAAPTAAGNLKLYPGKRNPKFNLRFQLTNKAWATGYNNFYEFTTEKKLVQHPFYMDKFITNPWQIQVTGLCEKPFTINTQQLIADMGVEERVYRFRCVEGWSMIVPWSGFSFRKIIEKAVPKKQAKFVKFTTAMNLKQMPGIARLPTYPWPYTEGLRLDEAMHELTFVATGIYGKPLPKQNGAPIRLVVPWKYGYKSIKSIVKIEFTAKQPKTLWESLAPKEYPFESNVNPAIAHPRWSQATERLIGTGLRIRTVMYNSYKEVAPLYARR